MESAGFGSLQLFVHSTAHGSFNQCPVVCYRIIEAEPSGEVIGFVAVGFQNAAGNIAAQAALAGHIYRLTRLYLIQPVPQVIQRNIT